MLPSSAVLNIIPGVISHKWLRENEGCIHDSSVPYHASSWACLSINTVASSTTICWALAVLLNRPAVAAIIHELNKKILPKEAVLHLILSGIYNLLNCKIRLVDKRVLQMK